MIYGPVLWLALAIFGFDLARLIWQRIKTGLARHAFIVQALADCAIIAFVLVLMANGGRIPTPAYLALLIGGIIGRTVGQAFAAKASPSVE